jgi:hypothetical protein
MGRVSRDNGLKRPIISNIHNFKPDNELECSPGGLFGLKKGIQFKKIMEKSVEFRYVCVYDGNSQLNKDLKTVEI